jgi:hypothetical protein
VGYTYQKPNSQIQNPVSENLIPAKRMMSPLSRLEKGNNDGLAARCIVRRDFARNSGIPCSGVYRTTPLILVRTLSEDEVRQPNRMGDKDREK